MGTISTEAPRTIAADIIPRRERRLLKSSFFMNRKRITPTRMAKIYPETHSQTGKTPSGKWICDIDFSSKKT
jgi:hypothetical protein